ncbi:unnamed protein product [Brachionus calyciflorus]|uniref:Uncharacterized protein n=1 Tax=Brachionus calyciflorus TaxID=104777 RepID=A0A814S6I5_9BILA|nr:unnamed protein product [Brachionus calyciflorus]
MPRTFTAFFVLLGFIISVQSLSYNLIDNGEYNIQSNSSTKFKVLLITNGSYALSINNKTWLSSSPKTFLRANNRMYSTLDRSLKLEQTNADSGYDQLGQYETFNFIYSLSDDYNTTAEYMIYTYDDYDMVRFSQVMVFLVDQLFYSILMEIR